MDIEPVYCCTVTMPGKRTSEALFAVYLVQGALFYGPGLRQHPKNVRALYRILRGEPVQLQLGGDAGFSGHALVPCAPSLGDDGFGDAGALTRISAPLDLAFFLHMLGSPMQLLDGTNEQEVDIHLGVYAVQYALPSAAALQPEALPANVVPLRRPAC